MAHRHQSQQQNEFLPLCDVLFNIISLASYFCDVVFDLAMGYALANHPTVPPILYPLSVFLIISSLLISQLVSVRWYLWGARGKLKSTTDNSNSSTVKKKFSNWAIWGVLLFHATQVGVLWRYFKLFIPVDLTYVKHEVRELCVLRLIHAFCEAAPMLLLQLYLLSIGIVGEQTIKDGKRESILIDDKLAELTAVSAGLSLWSVCWAVASFSKGAARLRNLERLVLTWLGVLAQLAWRIGTVSARIGALVAYASLYGGQWLLIVLALHWLSMLTWLLLTPDGLFHGNERLSIAQKTSLASLLAFIYIFTYLNLHETNHRQKMIIFYVVMFLENSLLIGVWAVGSNGYNMSIMDKQFDNLKSQPTPITVICILLALFFGGLSFMGLYYRFFHVRRLRYESGGRMNASNAINNTINDITDEKNSEFNLGDKKVRNDVNIPMRKVKLSNNSIPGVFNCRFTNSNVVNPNRKKKKPTTFVPPPPPATATQFCENKLWSNTAGDNSIYNNNHNNNNTRQLIPFWKRPISVAESNDDLSTWEHKNHDNDIQVGALNVHLIREKLREKKQQQLRELRAIQEEIKEGKLVPPPSASTSSFSSSLSQTNQQPPPNTKLHTSPTNSQQDQLQQKKSSGVMTPQLIAFNESNISITSWPPIKMHCLLPPTTSSPYHPTINYSTNVWMKTSGKTNDKPKSPEIVLAPRCLPHHYPHWTNLGIHRLRSNENNDENDNSKDKHCEDEDDRVEISDIEGSQISLPRSYTLPREFKYNNSNNFRDSRIDEIKMQSSRFYLPSTNSSDGDVDSPDNEDETDCELERIGDMKHYIHRLYDNQDESVSRKFNLMNTSNADNADRGTTSDPDNITRTTTVDSSILGYYSNNFHGPRVNHLVKAKVKHETKL
ncbi:hypothetical protein PV325_010447 [Microctonus aethiopoides]|uniref:XK-related protein n=1 Tax=Microctonus aethiopoides TaxID=144406 RepID=A0AA39C4X3_9HYME|nr:hypothetical protein PV325_010447 [Microctonus aethiopoides]KAK0157893.1 hypothetical protein PV328_011580 [Microctonus aethiopoides]